MPRTPIEMTLGSTLNIVYFAIGIVVVPSMMVLMRPRRADATVLDDLLEQESSTSALSVEQEAAQLKHPASTLSDSLNHGRIPQLVMVVGPSLVEAAKTVGVALTPLELHQLIAKIGLAVAYGETSTNLLQPFYLLIILPVMGAGVKLQARDVMGYMLIPFAVWYVFTMAILTWVPM